MVTIFLILSNFAAPYDMLLRLCGYYIHEPHMALHRLICVYEDTIFGKIVTIKRKNQEIKTEESEEKSTIKSKSNYNFITTTVTLSFVFFLIAC